MIEISLARVDRWLPLLVVGRPWPLLYAAMARVALLFAAALAWLWSRAARLAGDPASEEPMPQACARAVAAR